MKTSLKTTWVVGLLASPLWLGTALPMALGAEVYTVDSSQSSISITGSVLGSAFEEQGSGSLTTHYAGTLLADVTGSSIQFTGQSQVAAMDNGDWEPLADGSDGAAPANYGGKASAFLTTGVAALRQTELDLTSGVIAMANGQFDTQTITFSIPADATTSLAYRTDGAINSSGVVAVAGRSATGEQAVGSVAIVGGQEVLTIPIKYQVHFSLTTDNDTTVTFTGQLVATRNLAAELSPVPSLSSLAD